MQNPSVSAIVVGNNNRYWLGACLSSLYSSLYPSLRITYVDNASSDGSVAYVKKHFPETHILTNTRNIGYSGGNNRGIEHALATGAAYVFLINPDTRTPPQLVTRLVEFMEEWLTYGIVGPMQYTYIAYRWQPKLNDWSKEALINGERGVFHHWEPDGLPLTSPISGRAPHTLEHAYVQGAALFARGDTLQDIGLLDETYESFYEEVDLCRRARWAGYRVALLLDLGIQHFGGGGLIMDNPTQRKYRQYLYARNKYYYIWTDPTRGFIRNLRLTLRWAIFDLKDAIGPHQTISSAHQFAQIAGWLTSHLPQILQKRQTLARRFLPR